MPSINGQKAMARRVIVAEFLKRYDEMKTGDRRMAYETMINNVLVRITLEDMKRWAEWAKIDLGELK